MEQLVTLQRERRILVYPDGGLSVTDRWHVAIALGARRKAPLALIRATLLDAYGIAREIVRTNRLCEGSWQPRILSPVVRSLQVADAAGAEEVAPPRAKARPGARPRRAPGPPDASARRLRVAGLTLLHGATKRP